MAKDVVYLLGAGASNEVLPIVSEIPDRILEVAKILSSDERVSGVMDQEFDCIKPEKLYEDLINLSKECRRHISIDTIAKKYLIRGIWLNIKKQYV